MRTINLFNYFRYGDIFTSRISIQYLSKFFHINFYHNLKEGLLRDLDNVTEIIGIPPEIDYKNFKTNEFYNVWVGSLNEYSCNDGVCCFDSFKKILERICDDLSIEMPNDTDILPVINYEKLDGYQRITDVMINYKNKFHKIVLMSNGPVESSQSVNFDFYDIINKLCEINPNVLFITTTEIGLPSSNYISTDNITKTYPDLLEISLVSRFCNIIVGRASGPYTYCQTKENLFDKEKTIISFNNSIYESSLFLDSDSKQIWSNNYDSNFIFETIQNQI